MYTACSKYAEKFRHLNGGGDIFVRRDGQLLVPSWTDKGWVPQTLPHINGSAIQGTYTPTALTFDHTELIEKLSYYDRMKYLVNI